MYIQHIVKMIVLFLITIVSCFYNSIGIDVDVDYLSNSGNNKTPQNINYDINNARTLFENFVREHKKQYKDEAEFQRRYEIFVKNLIKINELNQKSLSEIYGITKFADMTMEEFYNGYTGLANYSSDSHKRHSLRRLLDDIEAPEELDWREQKLVTPVKDQLDCGSCWAFSAVGVVEGQYAKKHGELLSLSEQELVDCWTPGGGCDNGSNPDWALNGVSKMGGFMKSSDYPYKGVQGTCAFHKEEVVVRVLNGTLVKLRDEDELKNLLYQYGPLSIAIFASLSLQAYTGQVYIPNDSQCPDGVDSNHAVLLVGYGSDNGTPYWIIKNSWGEAWGEKGYLRMIRGKRACAIMSYISTADVA